MIQDPMMGREWTHSKPRASGDDPGDIILTLYDGE